MNTNEFDLLAELMSEPPGGLNHGARASEDPETEGRFVSLDVQSRQARAFMQGGGFSVVDTAFGSTTGDKHGYQDAGMTTHRGVLHPDEYVDHEALVSLVEQQLGVSFDEVHDIYRRAGGPLPTALHPRRAEIDAAFLVVANGGGDMTLLASVLGIDYATMKRALARARTSATAKGIVSFTPAERPEPEVGVRVITAREPFDVVGS